MIKEINHACGKLNDKLGVSIPLPNPGKKTMKITSACHFVVGVSLVAAGVVFSSKWCAALGSIGIISSVVSRQESGGGKDKP